MATFRRERTPILLNHNCLWYLSIMVNVTGLDLDIAIAAYSHEDDRFDTKSLIEALPPIPTPTPTRG